VGLAGGKGGRETMSGEKEKGPYFNETPKTVNMPKGMGKAKGCEKETCSQWWTLKKRTTGKGEFTRRGRGFGGAKSNKRNQFCGKQ